MPKTIGIMGGMGPAATVDLMSRIISMTDAYSDQEHIPMIVDNDTRIPDRTEALRQRCWQVPEDLRRPEQTS